MRPRFAASLLRYGLVGVSNGVVTIVAIFASKYLLGFGDVGANLVGYSLGMANSFVLNRRWSFQHKGRVTPALWRFGLVVLFAYLANLGVLLALIASGLAPDIAQMASIVPYVVIGFLGARFFAFR